MEKNNFRKIATITLFESAVQGIVSYYMEQQQELCLIKCFFHRREMEQQR